MDWQFYTYCRNVSMYKTRLLSWIDSSTLFQNVSIYKTSFLSWIGGSICIVEMFLCIKLGSYHGLAVLHLLSECFYV